MNAAALEVFQDLHEVGPTAVILAGMHDQMAFC